MLKKIVSAALALLLMPALVCAATVTVTVVTSGGTIQSLPYVPPPIKLTAGSSKDFKAFPNSGYTFTGATITAGSGVSVTALNTGTNTFSLTSTPAATNATVNVSFAAKPELLTANAGASQSAISNTVVALDGSKSTPVTGLTYNWQVTSANASSAHFSSTGVSKPTFSADAPGAYTIRLTVSKPSAIPLPTPSTHVTTVTFIAQALYNSAACTSCHALRDTALYAEYAGSAHASSVASPTCYDCHNPNRSPAHPTASPTGKEIQPRCQACHVTLKPLFANNTAHFRQGKSYWSYTNQNVCADCHNAHDPTTLAATNLYPSYADAGHADYRSGAWNHPTTVTASEATKGARNCGRCHNMNSFLSYVQGFADYSTGTPYPTPRAPYSWVKATTATVGDQTILGCRGCHTDAKGTIRATGAVTVYYNYTAAGNGLNGKVVAADYPSLQHTYPDSGPSNLCISCHTGRQSGESIVAWGEKFGGISSFNSTITTHDFPMGIDLYANAYNVTPFAAQLPGHESIGMAGYNNTGVAGPCATCHTFTGTDHSQAAVTLNADGTVSAIKKPAVCANCHISLDVNKLNDAKAAYKNSLAVIAQLLLNKGLMGSVSGSYPNQQFTAAATFTYGGTLNINKYRVTGWGGGQKGTDNLGLAMNLDQMSNRDKAGYAHNPAYVRKMMSDVIDLVDDGILNDSTAATVAGIVIDPAKIILPAGLTPEGVKGSAITSISRKEQANCNSCHSGTAATGSHSAHLGLSISCSTCHSATAASNTALVPGTTRHINGTADVVISPSGAYNAPAQTCSVYCHSNGTVKLNVKWGSAHLTCAAYCHPTLSGAHTAHVGNLLATGAAYGDGANYSSETMYRYGCATCHPAEPSMHMNGSVEVTLMPGSADQPLRYKNNLVVAEGVGVAGSGMAGTSGSSVVCSNIYCHSNGYVGGLVYAATPDWYGGQFTGDKCANCHGNSPSTTIPGSAAHAIHVVGIHARNIFNGNSGNLPFGSSGSVGHGIAGQSTTLNCNICHVDTVTSSRNDNNTICVSCHQSQGNTAQIANHANHVNGSVNVVFANISVISKAQLAPASFAAYSAVYWSRNAGNYKSGADAFDVSKMTLRNGALYDNAGGCSNVACHVGKAVNWSNTNAPSYCALCHTSI